jgi:hypothetical protein
MMLLIAILLALILVAMVSSNKEAAAGVGKAVQFAVIGAAMLGAWMFLIGYAIWYYQAYETSDIGRIIGIALPVLLPPFLCWVNRKPMLKRYREDRKAALRSTAVFVGSLGATMVMMPLYQEMKKLDDHLGWELLFATLAVTVTVLFFRSLAAGGTWPQVWMGLPPLADEWQILAEERDLARAGVEARYDAFDLARDGMTDEEVDAYKRESEDLEKDSQARLDALSDQLEGERIARASNDASLSVAKVFWFALIFSAIGLIVIAWEYAYGYAMGWAFVKGRSWLAVLVVAGAGVTIVSAFVSLLGMVAEHKASVKAKET